MKVILAGMPKTGTKSLNVALTQLGFKVYDIMEHFSYALDEWIALMEDTATSQPLREIYKDVDAVCDVPACYYWDEMLQLFPEAKVILMVRDDEIQWEKSFERQLKNNGNHWIAFVSYTDVVMFGLPPFKPWSRIRLSSNRAHISYRRHNAYVIQTAPKEKLLVYNVKEGWTPLCEFLNVEEPKTPFPHENKSGQCFHGMQEHPVFMQINREANITFGILAAVFAIATSIYWKFPFLLPW